MSNTRIHLSENKTYPWFTDGTLWLKGNFFDPDHNYYSHQKAFDYVTEQLKDHSLSDLVAKLNGIFTIVYRQMGCLKIACDPINFFPVFYARKDDRWMVADELSLIPGLTNHKEINEDAVPGFLSAGFVMDNETLIKNIFKTQAGEIVSVNDDGTISRETWYYFLPEQFNPSPLPELTTQLHEQLDALSRRMVAMLNGRTAIVPLSGGYDSRLIVSLLKKAGHKNTICITYGRENPEVAISREVAKKLGFQWIFVDYQSSETSGFLQDPLFREYAQYMGKGYSMPYLQEYFAARELKKKRLIPDDSVFLPGHNGDYIAGSYVLKSVRTQKKGKAFFNHLRKKYFCFAETTQKDNKTIEGSLQKLFLAYSNFNNPDPEFNVFIEDWHVREKISKFIFRSSHVFPFFGYEIYFPLWDKELVNFFRNVPFSFRASKMLYDKTLEEYLFKPYKIFFAEKELKAIPAGPWIASLKEWVKPFVPASLKIRKLRKNDAICYDMFTDAMKDDLRKRGETTPGHINSFNAIICRWYLRFLRDDNARGK